MPSPSTRHSAVAIAACTFAVQAAAGAGGLLRRVQYFPAGPFRSGDTRPDDVPAWRIDAASAARVIERFNARLARKPLVIDYEHQTLHKEKNGQPAPAAGWPRTLEWVEGEGLFGTVEMTARAAAAIDGREYLYFSPVFSYSKADGTVLEVLMGALTNDPGIQGMQPLSLVAAATAAFLPPPDLPQEPTVNPLLKALLAALGLPESTTEDAAIAALTALGPLQPLQARAGVASAACAALQLPADATPEAVTAAATSLRAAPADPARFVPVEAVSALQGQIAALTARQHEADVHALIQPALADGRLLPALEGWARELGKKDVAALTAYLDSAQPIAALTGTQTGGQPPGGTARGDAQLSLAELAVCTAMGLTPEQYKAGAAAAAAA
ncbi:Mu-like prophage I protein [Oryzisolibacter propanilivorax]|uniref:Mu-like prophage I protein n=1 Tax=Oryzisolibacter propanilivorax TaxID=1527607 RepID=A0A1G9UB17_9BURK|nr:phage protease [Oryzisolibacter propanilivorax]SDM57160.1 Mu-like prophage I protein [Oryzisolibacter propanilivorax]